MEAIPGPDEQENPDDRALVYYDLETSGLGTSLYLLR